MHKFSFYIFLILIFLGLSKNILIQRNYLFLNNQNDFKKIFNEGPISAILVDYYQRGNFLKTYFQEYLIVKGYKSKESIIIHTNEQFYKSTQKYIGMSLYRINHDNISSSLPLPPSSQFIGNLAMGYWQLDASGIRFWKFFKRYIFLENTYKKFYQYFTYNDYLKVIRHKMKKRPFHVPLKFKKHIEPSNKAISKNINLKKLLAELFPFKIPEAS